MGEQVEEEKEEFNEKEISEVIKNKVIEYLKENEPLLVAKNLLLYINDTKSVTQRLAKFFIAIKRELYSLDIIYKRKNIYGYTPEDIRVTNIDIASAFYEPRVDIKLPNGVTIAEIHILLNDEKMLQKKNYESMLKYAQQLETLLDMLKELAKQYAGNK
jgi:hypothetical protein